MAPLSPFPPPPLSSSTASNVARAVRAAFFNPRHFPKFFGAIFVTSAFAGYHMRDMMAQRRMEVRRKIYLDAYEAGSDRHGHHHHHGGADLSARATTGGMERMARTLTRRMTRGFGGIAAPSSEEPGSAAGIQRTVTKYW